MKKNTAFILLMLLGLIVFASEKSFANSTVDIHNVVNSSSSTSTSSHCNTSVHISTNGEDKTYTSDDCGQNVHMQSSDGNNSVDIKNNSNNDIMTIEPSGIARPTNILKPSVTIVVPSISVEERVKEKMQLHKNIQKHQSTFLQHMQQLFHNFFRVPFFSK